MAVNTEEIISSLDKLKLLATNNYPLARLFGLDQTNPDAIVGDELTDAERVLVLPATYNMIASNLMSFPYVIDTSDPDYIITTYKLDDVNTITKTVDTRDPNVIVSTLSGNVPNSVTLVNRIYISDTEIRSEF